MTPKDPSRASKNQTPRCVKSLKNLGFFNVFGYKRLSREPQGAQEGTQNTPKENQDPRGKDPILDPKIRFFLETNWTPVSDKKTHQKKTKKKHFLGPPSPTSQGSK